ncbi:MAG TPA: hypothetical protein DCF33_05405 [Saprospirales bacterium]|nr:hypothetical protein [Saprospirales bacterium]
MAKQTTPEHEVVLTYKAGPKFIQYKVGGVLALLMEVDGVLIEFPIYGQAYRTIQDQFTIDVVKEESTYNIIQLVKKPLK